MHRVWLSPRCRVDWGLPRAQGTGRSLLLTSRARVRVLAVAPGWAQCFLPRLSFSCLVAGVLPALGCCEGQSSLQAFSVALLSPPLAGLLIPPISLICSACVNMVQRAFCSEMLSFFSVLIKKNMKQMVECLVHTLQILC